MSDGRTPLLPSLDERLGCALTLAEPCRRAADIGADHGRLSLHLLAGGKCEHVSVCDISPASLSKAKRLLTFHGLEHRADFLVGDGLSALLRPVDAVFICGLGAEAITSIIERGAPYLGKAQLIVSAQTEVHKLRGAITRAGYHIAAEPVVRAGGRFYTVIDARPGEHAYTPRQLFIGPALVPSPGASLADYFTWRLGVLKANEAMKDGPEIHWLEEALIHEAGYSQDNT